MSHSRFLIHVIDHMVKAVFQVLIVKTEGASQKIVDMNMSKLCQKVPVNPSSRKFLKRRVSCDTHKIVNNANDSSEKNDTIEIKY